MPGSAAPELEEALDAAEGRGDAADPIDAQSPGDVQSPGDAQRRPGTEGRGDVEAAS
jgi:hypothetical protein